MKIGNPDDWRVPVLYKDKVTVLVKLHRFRAMLDAAEAAHAERCCTSCGARLVGRAWDGGAGRRLCSKCGPAEGARLERKKPTPKRSNG